MNNMFLFVCFKDVSDIKCKINEIKKYFLLKLQMYSLQIYSVLITFFYIHLYWCFNNKNVDIKFSVLYITFIR